MKTTIHLLPLTLLLTWGVPAQAGLPLGRPVERAAALHITNGGLAHLGDAIEALAPRVFPVKGLSGEFYCSAEDTQPLVYSLDTLDVLISADNVVVAASEGRLDITLYGTLNSSASTLEASGNCAILTGLDEVCTVQLPTTAIQANLGLTISESGGVFDVTADDVSLYISPIGNPISNCTLADAAGMLMGQNPNLINDLIMSYVEPELEGLGATIEQPIEDALNNLTFETDLDLGGAPLHLSLYPSLLNLGRTGIIIGFGATVDVEASSCVDTRGGSEFADAPWPEFDENVVGSDLAYDAGVVLNRDFTDHLLFAVYASGLLCYDLTELNGAPITSSTLGPFLGDAFQALYPEDVPLSLELRPASAPRTVFDDDDPPIAVSVDDLALSLYAPLDVRDIRLFQTDVAAQIGLSVEITDKLITPTIALDPAAITFREVVNEFLPAGFSDGIGDLIPVVLGAFNLDSLLSSYPMPDLMGIRLGGEFWIPSPDGQWQGLYVLVDSSQVEALDLGGCSGGSLGCGGTDTGTGSGIDFESLLGCSEKSKGCGASKGCEGSTCNAVQGVTTIPARLLYILILGSLVMLRRSDD